MRPRQIFIYWLWAVAILGLVVVLLVPAPAIDPATLTVARADEGWRVTRLNITNRATDNLAELPRP